MQLHLFLPAADAPLWPRRSLTNEWQFGVDGRKKQKEQGNHLEGTDASRDAEHTRRNREKRNQIVRWQNSI
eukprot:1855611-Prymnesium_polylepis.2